MYGPQGSEDRLSIASPVIEILPKTYTPLIERGVSLMALAAAPLLPSAFLSAEGRIGFAYVAATILSSFDLNSTKLAFRQAL